MSAAVQSAPRCSTSASVARGPCRPLGVHRPASTQRWYAATVTSVRSRSNARVSVTSCGGRSDLPPFALPIVNR
ncbi:hypothetical protein BE17_34185, partial [Sorangium cellulosum]